MSDMNPPAFPSHGSMGEVAQEGMGLRDFYTGAAITGLLARDIANHHDAETIVARALAVADEALTQRSESLYEREQESRRADREKDRADNLERALRRLHDIVVKGLPGTDPLHRLAMARATELLDDEIPF
jgi:hypothetical protein